MGGFERYLSVTPPRDAAGRQTRRLRPEHERSRPLPATFLGPMNALAACHWKRTLELVLVLELALALALALVLEVMPELARPCVTVSHDAAHQSHLTRLIAAMAARLLSALRLLILGVLEHNFHPSCARRGQAAWSAWVGGRRQVMAPGWRVCQASRSRRSARRFGARRRMFGQSDKDTRRPRPPPSSHFTHPLLAAPTKTAASPRCTTPSNKKALATGSQPLKTSLRRRNHMRRIHWKRQLGRCR